MHQVPVIWNQAHRPLILASLVPEIFVDKQRELVRSMGAGVRPIEGDTKRRCTVKHPMFQIVGLCVPPPISKCQYGYDEHGGYRHCAMSNPSIACRGKPCGRPSAFAPV